MSVGAVAQAFRSLPPRCLCRSLHASAVRLKDNSVENKPYAKSLLLPRTTFPQWTDPLKKELLMRKKSCDDLYRCQVKSHYSASGTSHPQLTLHHKESDNKQHS